MKKARRLRPGPSSGVSATAFHWLNEESALIRIAELLRPGGWWAMAWNVFGDNRRPDPFHEATRALLNGPSGPSARSPAIPFALDTEARVAALERVRAFDAITYQASVCSPVLDADQTIALDATFSIISTHPDREAVLADPGRIARDEFHGCVTRNMTTSHYAARRRRGGYANGQSPLAPPVAQVPSMQPLHFAVGSATA